MITLQNPGLIDLDAIRIMGVNVKETDSPIGYFGTGLKFAIATLLRTGHRITLWRGEERFEFSAQQVKIRNKAFQAVFMNEEKLAFTTDLGRNWEVWMAFRELYSNMLDEGGKAKRGRTEPSPDQTIFEVRGEAFERAYEHRNEIFLNKVEIGRNSAVSVYETSSPTIFYRGVRVHKLPKRSFFTYNLEAEVSLTEDRTLQYPWQMDTAIASWLKRGANEAQLMKLIEEATDDYFERNCYITESNPSETFKSILAREINNPRLPKTWRSRAKQFKEEAKGQAFEPFELSDRQREKLGRALALCKDLGANLDPEEIKFVRSLGNEVLGLCDNRQIYIAETTFDWGISTLAATLYEEFLHRDHDLADESRAMQNFLLQKLISLVE